MKRHHSARLTRKSKCKGQIAEVKLPRSRRRAESPRPPDCGGLKRHLRGADVGASSQPGCASHHVGPHEQRLRAVVGSLVADEAERVAYLQFARELARTLRRPQPERQARAEAPESGSGPETENWKLGTATMRRRPFPDYSPRTKSIVAKWFERGLSGHLLWLIGQTVRQERVF